MTEEELAAIVERDKKTPGGWYSDACGAPVVTYSYGERLVNRLIHETDLYLRRKKDERPEETNRRWIELGKWFNSQLADAYQTARDRRALLELVRELRGEA